MNKEIRDNSQNINLNNRMVEGYAVVFDSVSQNIGWYETIHKGAITQDVINNSDIFVKFNHDDSKVLARSKHGEGSLKLEIDEKGLKYSFEAPCTALGDELLEYIKRGDISSSSFAFSLDKTDKTAEKWSKVNGELHRDIYKINELFDVSPVFQPAYSDTNCCLRYKEISTLNNEVESIINVLREEINKL